MNTIKNILRLLLNSFSSFGEKQANIYYDRKEKKKY